MCVVLAAIALAGCSGASGGDAVLRADIVGTFDDPASPPRLALTQATQLGLVQFDSAGQVVPGLAASWRVVDGGRSIIFRLRDARWSDGRTLKAADVVAAFRRIMAPGSRNTLKPLLAAIDNSASVGTGRAPVAMLGVTAPLETVVEVRLSAPDAGMLEVLALPGAAIVRTGAGAPSIGAFRVVEPGKRPLILKRNPAYFAAARVRLASIALMPAGDPVAAVTRFVRGETDLVAGDGIAGFGEARTLAPRGTLKVEAALGSYGYRINLGREALGDARVRQALAMAIDRDALVTDVFGSAVVVPLTTLVPPDVGTGAPLVPGWAGYDLASRRAFAIRLLAAAGYGPGKPLRLSVGVPPGREHVRVFDRVAADWAALGVISSVIERSPAAQGAAITRGDYDLAVVERSAPVASPMFFLRPFTCAARSGYCNPSADRLLAGGSVREAEAAMLADTPMIPLFVPMRWSLVAPGVTGWVANPGGRHPFAALDIEETRK